MIGKEILNYTIVSMIGKGGMGSVYLAENKYIKKQKVAIKVINSDMVNGFTKNKLAEEADRLARLNHPNIVHFINYHIDEAGNIYLVMEYAEGHTLEEFIKNINGLVVEDKVLKIFDPLLDAFQYAHENNVLHRDIKPSNIIISEDGTPKILDFGISTLLDEGDKEGGMIMGTPSYMSPEQVRGEKLDQRSDIYSLGVMLHHTMTGCAPYDTTTMTEQDIYRHVVNEDLPSMKSFYKYISDKTQKVVTKATSKKPEARFQSCEEFKKALDNAINPPKVSRSSKIVMAAAIAVLLGGLFFIYDYNRTKVSYYKDYVEQWGVPQGIGKISGAARKHTHKMFRFEYCHYKLQKVSHVNSIGTVLNVDQAERNDRAANMVFYYDDDNKLTRTKVMDQSGKVLYVKSYNENLSTAIFQYDDEHGTEKTIGNKTVASDGLYGSGGSKGNISRFLYEYDANGYVMTIRYAGFQNVLVGDESGIYGKQYVRDEKGRVLEELYLAYDGTLKATKWGLGKMLFEYDERDNWITTTYQTVDGKPSLNAENGISVCVNEHDEYGNVTAIYFKNSNGDLVSAAAQGCAGTRLEYDGRGYIMRSTSLGVDGNPVINSQTGYAIQESDCNEFGFFKDTKYFDAEGEPMLDKDGVHRTESVTDCHGNLLEIWYYDLEGNKTEHKSGYSGLKAEYDSLGQVVRYVTYGTDGNPCEGDKGTAGWVVEYNGFGGVTKQTYLGTDLLPTVSNDNVCSLIIEYDSRGNVTKYLHCDENGDLVAVDAKVAVTQSAYDEYGNEVCRTLFDTEGKMAVNSKGWAKLTQKYDGSGHLLSIRYYNAKDQYVLVDGVAGYDYQRDSHGNMTEMLAVGTDGKSLAKGKLIARYKYDERDNNTEFSVFNADGKPVLNSDNIHKHVQVFNERNQIIEDRYYDTKGALTQYGKQGWCIRQLEYNENGQTVKIAFFDKKEKPVVNKEGYAVFTKEYDKYGRLCRELYFDTEGNPTKPSVMVPEGIVKYDKWGNIIFVASADGNGNYIMSPERGWSVWKAEFDRKGNKLSESYFNENENAILCKDGFHKAVYTYTKGDKEESVSYFGKKEEPILVNGYHTKKTLYNENNLFTEIVYTDKNGKEVNCTYGYCREKYTYDKSNQLKECKCYNTAGKQVSHFQRVNGEWEAVKNWQNDVNTVIAQLPMDLGEDLDNMVLKSAKILSSSAMEFTAATPKSKYDMSDSMIAKYKSYMSAIAAMFRSSVPSGVKVTGILKDSKGRVIESKKY